jgi:hypothetical protein
LNRVGNGRQDNQVKGVQLSKFPSPGQLQSCHQEEVDNHSAQDLVDQREARKKQIGPDFFIYAGLLISRLEGQARAVLSNRSIPAFVLPHPKVFNMK